MYEQTERTLFSNEFARVRVYSCTYKVKERRVDHIYGHPAPRVPRSSASSTAGSAASLPPVRRRLRVVEQAQRRNLR